MATFKKKRNLALAFAAAAIVAVGVLSWGLTGPATAHPGYTCNPPAGHGTPGCHVSATTTTTAKPATTTTTSRPATTTTVKASTSTTTKASTSTTTKVSTSTTARASTSTTTKAASNPTTTATTGLGAPTTTQAIATTTSQDSTTTVEEQSSTALDPTTSVPDSTSSTDSSALIAGSVDGGEGGEGGDGGGPGAGWIALLIVLGILTGSGWTLAAVKMTAARKAAAGGGALGSDPVRFVLSERLGHWFYASCFLAAGVTGALMWIPRTAQGLAGAYFTVARYHGYLGLAMVVVPLAIFLLFDRRRFAENRRTVDEWTVNDRRWLRAALTGGLFRGRPMPPQGRFNAGQKINSHLVAGLTLAFLITGVLLLSRGHLPVVLASAVLFTHKVLAVAAGTLIVGHVSMALLTRHGRGGLKAMVRGILPAHIAREGHALWYAEWLEQRRRADTQLPSQTTGGNAPA